MKMIIAFAAILAVALAAPQKNPEADAFVVKYENDNIGLGGYHVAVETSNGIRQEETAQLNNPGQENESIAVRGSYEYPGPDGVVYVVNYVADENGFQPQGAHLPVAP